jgi:polyisoprenoid-binding protein YceI
MNTTSTIAIRSLLSLSLGCLALACNNDPAKGKTQATVSSATAPVVAAAPAADAVRYAFSNDGSTLEFTGAKVSAKHEGSFKAFRGTINVVGGDATKSNVNVEIDIASMAIDPAKLAGHLKSADFFDAEKFPKGKFVSTAIKAGGEGGATHTVSGNLELHGVSKGITFPAKIKIEAEQVAVDAEFAINRKDFSIVYPGMPDDLIKDDVLIKLSLRAKKVP